MEFLYKTYALEKIGNDGRALLPGYPMQPDMRQLEVGDKIQVELADGTMLETTILQLQFLEFEGAAAEKLRVKPGFHCAITVPNDFDAPGIELGAKVFVQNTPATAT